MRTMGNGDIDVEIFYSGSLVKSSETFDAVRNGVASCDMTNGSYQTGKDPAFQFVADVMGGYDNPLQFMSWIYYGGGKQAHQRIVQQLQHAVCWRVHGRSGIAGLPRAL